MLRLCAKCRRPAIAIVWACCPAFPRYAAVADVYIIVPPPLDSMYGATSFASAKAPAKKQASKHTSMPRVLAGSAHFFGKVYVKIRCPPASNLIVSVQRKGGRGRVVHTPRAQALLVAAGVYACSAHAVRTWPR